MSNHDLIRLIRFVSRFTVHLCNAIYFSTTFSIPGKQFTKIFRFLDLNRAQIFKCTTCPLLQQRHLRNWVVAQRIQDCQDLAPELRSQTPELTSADPLAAALHSLYQMGCYNNYLLIIN